MKRRLAIVKTSAANGIQNHFHFFSIPPTGFRTPRTLCFGSIAKQRRSKLGRAFRAFPAVMIGIPLVTKPMPILPGVVEAIRAFMVRRFDFTITARLQTGVVHALGAAMVRRLVRAKSTPLAHKCAILPPVEKTEICQLHCTQEHILN